MPRITAEKTDQMPTTKPLNAKQKLFVEEYVKTASQAKAAEASGYSRKHCWKLLNTPQFANVQAAVEAGLAKRAEKAELDADYVLDELRSLYDECRGEKNHKTAAKCLELMGKHLAMWINRSEHSGKMTVADLMLSIAEEDLDEDSGEE